ncbi:MAG: DUF433 domain-containing protein [Pyrinomonadaceae bacterium]
MPLVAERDGGIYVAETGVPVERVIFFYLQGEIPESIVGMFPSLKVSDVYAVIAYYLSHREEMDRYVRGREREANEIRRHIESAPGYAERSREVRTNLRHRWQERQKPSSSS